MAWRDAAERWGLVPGCPAPLPGHQDLGPPLLPPNHRPQGPTQGHAPHGRGTFCAPAQIPEPQTCTQLLPCQLGPAPPLPTRTPPAHTREPTLVGASNCLETPFFPEVLEHLATLGPREPLHLFPSPPALGLETPSRLGFRWQQGWPRERGPTPK